MPKATQSAAEVGFEPRPSSSRAQATEKLFGSESQRNTAQAAEVCEPPGCEEVTFNFDLQRGRAAPRGEFSAHPPCCGTCYQNVQTANQKSQQRSQEPSSPQICLRSHEPAESHPGPCWRWPRDTRGRRRRASVPGASPQGRGGQTQ